MSTYRPRDEPWHEQVPGECSCGAAWADREMVDDYCDWHRLIDAVEALREAGWTVAP